jgi:hypothetical protein
LSPFGNAQSGASEGSRTKLTTAAAVLGAGAAILATFHRLHFGVHFEDEPFYIATPFRFVLGDRIFVDDLSIFQGSALLLYPVVKVYYGLKRSTEGIILFTRMLYLGYTLVIAGIVFGVLRRRMPWVAALFTGLMCIVYAHFNIYNLSYNTMGSGFLVAGLFLGVQGTLGDDLRARVALTLSGLAHALAAVVYPTFVLVTAVFVAVLAACLPRPRWRGLRAFCLGAGAVGLPFAAFLFHVGIDRIVQAVEFTRAWGGEHFAGEVGGLGKLRALVAQAWWSGRPWTYAPLLAASLLAVAKGSPTMGLFLASLLPIVAFAPSMFGVAYSNGFVVGFSLVAPVLALVLWDRPFVRRLFVLGWLPALLAGVVSSWSSDNGIIAAPVGLFPACLVSNVLVVLWASDVAGRCRFGFVRGLRVLPAVVAVGALVYFQYAGRSVYWDAPIARLDHRVMGGPFRGIFTTREKATLLQELSADLPAVVNPRGKILFYPDFAAGYLMTTMRPASALCWVGGVFDLHASWYRQRSSSDDVVVRLKFPSGSGFARLKAKILDDAVFPLHRIVIERPWYVILTGSPSSPLPVAPSP